MASSEVSERSFCSALLCDADEALDTSRNQMDLLQRKGPHLPLSGMASCPDSHHCGKEREKNLSALLGEKACQKEQN